MTESMSFGGSNADEAHSRNGNQLGDLGSRDSSDCIAGLVPQGLPVGADADRRSSRHFPDLCIDHGLPQGRILANHEVGSIMTREKGRPVTDEAALSLFYTLPPVLTYQLTNFYKTLV